MATTVIAQRVRAVLSRQTFAAFELRDYRLLWANNFSFALVQGIERFAFSWLVIDILAAGDIYLGLAAFTLGIPVFFFSLPAGVLADRWNRRILLIVSQVIVLAGALLAAVLLWMDLMTLRVALGMALFVGTGVAVGQPVRQALIPAVVPTPRLMNAITLNTAGQTVSQMLGRASGASPSGWRGSRATSRCRRSSWARGSCSSSRFASPRAP